MEIRNLDLPQLIVALDSVQDDSNYVHIRDVRENNEYYCPCCKRPVKPRAYKANREYQVQPHFYHSDGCCSEESRVHWLYKNWLFKEGSRFEVNGVIYNVSNVDIEEMHNTSFGGYKPDITVDTKEGKRFFFKINFTNAKKENDYFCKWCELNIDVAEVDVKKLLNSDYNGEVPVFELIYSDGVCYKKDYEKRDLYASTIGVRKLEWKRQDKINYKMMWEKLDWFWQELQRYIHKEDNVASVLESFKNLDFKDMEFCIKIIHNHKLEYIEVNCIAINNSIFYNKLKELKVELVEISPRRFRVEEYIIDKIYHSFKIATTWTPNIKGTRFLQSITDNLITNVDIKNRIISNILSVEEPYKKYLRHIEIGSTSIVFHSYIDCYNHISLCTRSFEFSELTDNDKLNNFFKDFEDKWQKEKQKVDELREKQKQAYERDVKKILSKNDAIIKQRELYVPILEKVIKKINNCHNHAWKCEFQWVNEPSRLMGYFECKKEVKISIIFTEREKSHLILTFEDLTYDTLVDKLTKEMNYIVKYSGLEMRHGKRRYYTGSSLSRALFVRGE